MGHRQTAQIGLYLERGMIESFTAGKITAGGFHCWVTAGGVTLQEGFTVG